MFCNSSGLTFHGGSFNNIGGDMTVTISAYFKEWGLGRVEDL
jgi:hypothetical protein